MRKIKIIGVKTGFYLVWCLFHLIIQTRLRIKYRVILNEVPLKKLEFDINRTLYKIENSPDILRQLNPYEQILSMQAGSLPYRQTIQLITLVKASCALRRRKKIEQRDIDKIIELCRFINYKMEDM